MALKDTIKSAVNKVADAIGPDLPALEAMLAALQAREAALDGIADVDQAADELMKIRARREVVAARVARLRTAGRRAAFDAAKANAERLRTAATTASLAKAAGKVKLLNDLKQTHELRTAKALAADVRYWPVWLQELDKEKSRALTRASDAERAVRVDFAEFAQ